MRKLGGLRKTAKIGAAVGRVALAGCPSRPSSAARPANRTAAVPTAEISHRALALYDGAKGRPAYIAVRGPVYDVTNASGWKDGVHAAWSPERVAGRDLTEFLKPGASVPPAGAILERPAAGRQIGGPTARE